MKFSKYIATLLILINSTILFGSCYVEVFSITELLNHDPKNHHIFTCEILKTYVRPSGFESVAVINRKFKGKPNDTIYIYSGGKSTAGGQKLYPKSEWLIFSTTEDSLHYNATICDPLSTRISNGDNDKCTGRLSPKGKIYINVLETYEEITKSNYSGFREITVDGNLIAKGAFKSGLPHGQWVHYSRYDNFKKDIKRSEITYRDGMLHGRYNIHLENEDQNFIIEKRKYELNRPILIEKYRGNLNELHRYCEKKYNYKSDHRRIVTLTYYDTTGNRLKQTHTAELDFNSKRYETIKFRHGYYFNKHTRSAGKYDLLAEGYYYRGARIGEWKFFNKKGDSIESKTYPNELDTVSQFQVIDQRGFKVNGLYRDGKRIGIWRYYYDKRLKYEKVYASNGNKLSKTDFYSSGAIEITPYRNNVKHGSQIVFYADNSIKSIKNYKNGKRSGKSIFFNNDSTLRKESRFVNSREFTVTVTDSSGYMINGFLNGYVVNYDHNTGKKLIEGRYWNGYKVGVWIKYKKDGSYQKRYYPTDKKVLVNQCSFAVPKLIEKYDKEGNLIDSRSFE